MKTRRWMKILLEDAKKTQTEMPWTRQVRVVRRAEKPRQTRIKAAV